MNMKTLSLALIASLLIIFGCSKKPELTGYVNPFIGTGGHGHTFPGATLPFGMVQLSPDTRIDGSWDGCGGYHYSDSLIYGFSHTHLSGTGVSDYGDFMLMPLIGEAKIDQTTYGTSFLHTNEIASPGYYAVTMDNGIKAELTTSYRVGFHRYTFPESDASIVMDLHHRDYLIDGDIEIVDHKTIAAKRISKAWAKEQHAYAYFQFSKDFDFQFNDDSTKVILKFKSDKEPLLIKTGFSFVSIAGAKMNLEAEINHWNFDKQKDLAREIWNKAFSKIEVESIDEDKLTVFYTALYHVMIQPNLAMDIDKQYRGRDNKIHTAKDFDYYTVFSLWDTFRAAHPLYTIIDRKRTNDFIKTFLAQYEQGGRLPVWEFASNETDCMIGYHSVSVIADAAIKGIGDFDKILALEAMKKSATWNHFGLSDYIKNGYLSVEDEHESVSKTLEYAYDDWCIAQIAANIGDTESYKVFMNRSQAWKNLMDPETGFMRPRKNGGWIAPFDPKEVNNHFTEGNSWQYSFFVLQDIYGLEEMMGGKDSLESKLNELFSTNSNTTGRTQADITGLIGQYAHGNEPSHHMTYLYDYVGRADKTAQLVNKILKEFYTPKPDGLIGNEDCGQMSAWFVLSSLGLYQVNPGSNYFLLNAPYFDKATIHLENGKSIKITAKNLTSENLYPDKIALNGDDYKQSSYIKYAQLMEGPSIEFEMSDLPRILEAGQYPPKEKTSKSIVLAPVIKSEKRSFIDSLTVIITKPDEDNDIYYTLDGSNPTVNSIKYSGPIILNATTEMRAICADKQGNASGSAIAKFYKKPNNYSIKILSVYDPQYSAGGNEGLIDGIRGDENWRKGDWQGYQDQDFEAIIDMQKPQMIYSISAGFLQDTRSWIIFPKEVQFYTSLDGENFTLLGSETHNIQTDDYTTQTGEIQINLSKPAIARFVKVKAINFGTLPVWHIGAGYQAFIFVDEIQVSTKTPRLLIQR